MGRIWFACCVVFFSSVSMFLRRPSGLRWIMQWRGRNRLVVWLDGPSGAVMFVPSMQIKYANQIGKRMPFWCTIDPTHPSTRPCHPNDPIPSGCTGFSSGSIRRLPIRLRVEPTSTHLWLGSFDFHSCFSFVFTIFGGFLLDLVSLGLTGFHSRNLLVSNWSFIFTCFFFCFHDFLRVLLGLNEFQQVLLGFTEFHLFKRILAGFTGFYWVLLGSIWFYWVLLGSIWFYWVLLGITRFHFFLTNYSRLSML